MDVDINWDGRDADMEPEVLTQRSGASLQLHQFVVRRVSLYKLLWLGKEAGIKCNFKQQVTTYFCMQFKGDYVILNFNSFRTDLTYRKESNKNKNKVKYEVTDYVVDVMMKFISLWL